MTRQGAEVHLVVVPIELTWKGGASEMAQVSLLWWKGAAPLLALPAYSLSQLALPSAHSGVCMHLLGGS